MSYSDFESSLARQVSWLLVLKLDYCEHVHGSSPCSASGAPYCYYTYSTCKDPDNYSRGSRDYVFSLARGPRVAGAIPCLEAIKTVPTEIRPKESVTRRARVTCELIDDAPLALANPDKSLSNAETGGSFLRNLLARNPNAIGRQAELWRGFDGLAPEDYRLVFRGVIDKVEWSEDRTKIVLKDQLKLLDAKAPKRQSDDNALSATYNGGAAMSVAKGHEFEAPGTAKVDSEYVTFTGVSGDTLTGCSPGAHGTSATAHPAGTRVSQVLALSEPDSGGGMPPDELFMELLVSLGKIDPLMIATVDRGVCLDGAVSSGAASIEVDDYTGLPETGVIRIGDELVRYRGIGGSGLAVAERGAYGTAAAAHADGAAALPVCFTDELGRWWSGALFRRRCEKEVAIKDLVNSLREQCLCHVWQGEDGLVHAKCVAPPYYAETPASLDDETGFIRGSTSWDQGAEYRVSRITVHYGPNQPDPGKNADSYDGLLVYVDAEAESGDFYGEKREHEVYASWIYREHEALLLAARHIIRYRSGAETFRFSAELKDAGLAVGDYVFVDSKDVIGPSGANRSRALFEVIKKKDVSDNRVEYAAIDTRLDRRYPVISPASVSHDYDSASSEEKDIYGWAGDSDNLAGSAGDDGYYIY